jgi:hypothetical protein
MDTDEPVKTTTTLKKAVLYFHWKLVAPLLFFNSLYPVMNFEVYFYPAADTNNTSRPNSRYEQFCKGSAAFHRKHGGRTEMRAFGSAVGLDVFVPSHAACVLYVRDVIETLLVDASLVSSEYKKFACHPGKLRIDKFRVEKPSVQIGALTVSLAARNMGQPPTLRHAVWVEFVNLYKFYAKLP